MSEKIVQEEKSGDSAEKAYAAAAQATVTAAAEPEAAPEKPVALPSLKRGKVAVPAARDAKPAVRDAKPAVRDAKPAVRDAKPAAKVAAPAKTSAAKSLPPLRKDKTAAATKQSSPASSVKAGPGKVRLPGKIKNKAAPIVSARQPRALPNTHKHSKETIMNISNTVTEGFKSVVNDAQEKAQKAYDKSSAAFGDYAEFTKGNVEALVESGKILAAGLQDLGSELVIDSKQSVETLTADVKQLAAAKSPSEIVKLQGELVRRNFDKAVAYNTKAGEAMFKLVNEMFVPLSGRISLAMDKVGKAA